MVKNIKKLISFITMFCIVFCMIIGSSFNAYCYASNDKVKEAIEKTSDYMKENDTYSSDWKMVGLVNAGQSIPTEYLKNTEDNIKNNDGYFMKVTDYERISIGISAAKGDPRDIGGYNLIEKIYNFEDGNRDITFQGLNGVVFGLIALDSNRYEIPKDAKYSREWLVNYILENQNEDGGWDLNMSGNSDVDITAMAITSLAPYHDNENVIDSIDQAVNWLSGFQREDNGGFNSWGADNSESVSQVIIGLCANGIDPTSDEFTKNGNNLIDALLSFEVGDGTFLHVKEGQPGNIAMSTEQAYQALLAYDKFVDMGSEYCAGENSIYYFEESEPLEPKDDEEYKELEAEYDVKQDKEWRIKFNQQIDKNTADTENIVVLNSKGEKYPIYVEPIEGNLAIKVSPQSPYNEGEKYTLYVKSKNVHKKITSINGKILKRGVKKEFTITE